MSKKELKQITPSHVLRAIEISRGRELSPSSAYDLLYEGEKFPPAEIIKIASKEANGKAISNIAGKEYYSYLKELGFDVVDKTYKIIGSNREVSNSKKVSKLKKLKPDKSKSVGNVYKQCEEEDCDKVVYNYLFKAMDRILIDEDIFINKNKNKGWSSPALAVLKFHGLTVWHKGIFVGRNIEEALDILKKQEHNVDTIIKSLCRIKYDNYSSNDDYLKEDYIYQKEIETLVNNSEASFTKDIPEAKPKRNNKMHANGYGRNSRKGKNAIENANFMCEVDNKHKDFTSNATGKNYVEAHHLIPMEFQDSFDVSIDVEANIVSLCVSCHKRLHHAIFKEKEEVINVLYRRRENRLSKCGINISQETLYGYYE